MYNDTQRKHIRKKLRGSLPKGEVLLWNELKQQKLGVKFRRQYGVGVYTLDFYAPSIRLCIEVDGYSHQGEIHTKDVRRDVFLMSKEITVLRFTSDQVFDTIESVIIVIQEKIKELA